MTHFTIIYNNVSIEVTGSGRIYTLTYPDKTDIIIEKNADGWFMLKALEQHWTDHDIVAIGGMIESKINKQII